MGERKGKLQKHVEGHSFCRGNHLQLRPDCRVKLLLLNTNFHFISYQISSSGSCCPLPIGQFHFWALYGLRIFSLLLFFYGFQLPQVTTTICRLSFWFWSTDVMYQLFTEIIDQFKKEIQHKKNNSDINPWILNSKIFNRLGSKQYMEF